MNTGTPDQARAVGASGANSPELLDEVNAISDEEIAKEDFETHFNLGIAYREMDLLDDAIKEFQIAFKTLDPTRSPKEVVRCCGMLSTCFLEKGMPQSTIRWCQTGLSMPEISQHESIALRYDMGVAFSELAEYRHALECFSKIFGMDPGFRDVAQKIDSLRGRS
jgi:tetratricopeptide (TPR) repeat protein